MRDRDVLLTPASAARLLQLSADRVRDLIDAGELPAQRTESGIRLVSKGAVLRLARERQLATAR